VLVRLTPQASGTKQAPPARAENNERVLPLFENGRSTQIMSNTDGREQARANKTPRRPKTADVQQAARLFLLRLI